MKEDSKGAAPPAERGYHGRPEGQAVPRGPEVARTSTRGLGFVLLLGLAALAVWRSAIGTRLDSLTIDEPWHIVAGAEYARTSDFRLNPEHPPLVKLWVGAAMPPSFRLRPASPISEKEKERELVEETFYHDNDFRTAQTRARRAMWLFHSLLLLGLGLLLWRALGFVWAAGTMAFLAVEPTVGAHLPVVMTDLPVALCLTIAALTGGLLLETWGWGWASGFGLALGLALGSKHSALPGAVGIVALCAASALAFEPRSLRESSVRLGKVLAACALAVFVLWALYGLHFHGSRDGRDRFNRPMPDKIAELRIAPWRGAIRLADDWRLLPRSYLWGLADTVRAGVEGRGDSTQFLWGVQHKGRPPWFTWPSFVLIKVPLGLLVMALLGMLSLMGGLPPGRWAPLLAVAAMGAAHLLALSTSQGAYAGVRHALPIVLVLGVVAGGGAWRAQHTPSKALGAAIVACLVAALAMTLGERRLWEYHNELVGGTANAWRFFANESMDLGQRAYELEGYVRKEILPEGKRFYFSYMIPDPEMAALGLHGFKKVEDIHDTNVAGVWEGYFIYGASDQVPFPEDNWDPSVVFKDLVPLSSFGHAIVFKGRQVSPGVRARWMYRIVSEYVHKKGGSDWELVAQRLEEVVSAEPTRSSAAVELGNAYLRLRRREDAIRAYRQPLTIADRGLVDDLTRRDLEAQIARLDGGESLGTVPPLRPRTLE